MVRPQGSERHPCRQKGVNQKGQVAPGAGTGAQSGTTWTRLAGTWSAEENVTRPSPGSRRAVLTPKAGAGIPGPSLTRCPLSLCVPRRLCTICPRCDWSPPAGDSGARASPWCASTHGPPCLPRGPPGCGPPTLPPSTSSCFQPQGRGWKSTTGGKMENPQMCGNQTSQP